MGQPFGMIQRRVSREVIRRTCKAPASILKDSAANWMCPAAGGGLGVSHVTKPPGDRRDRQEPAPGLLTLGADEWTAIDG